MRGLVLGTPILGTPILGTPILGTVLLVALTVSGCSIFNHFDPGLRDAGGELDGGMDGGPPDDGGIDAGDDADAPSFDGGPDTDPDAWTCPATRESDCADGHDDDCDHLVDCADPDCVGTSVSAAVCCAGATHTVTDHFALDGTGLWTTASSWSPSSGWSARIGDPSPGLFDLPAGSLVGMVHSTCLRVDLGMEVRFEMQAQSCSGTECAGHLDVVIGPSSTFTGMLTDDLGIRGTSVDGDLRIEVVQGGSVRATSPMLGTTPATVVVRLSPGVANGEPAIVGSVVVSSSTGDHPLVSSLYVTDRDRFGTTSCHGLHLGVQGVGSHVAVDDLSITQLDCANPARFDVLGTDSPIDAVTMSVSDGASTGWGRGGIGDPALLQIVSGGSPRFVLLYDGSPVDRASDVIGHLPLSIGGADSTATVGTGTDLSLTSVCTNWTPRGSGNTQCVAQPSASSHSVVLSSDVMRDPTIYPISGDASAPTALELVWVGESGGSTDLQIFDAPLATGTSSTVGVPTARDLDDPACASVRNPLLLPLLPLPSAGTPIAWLLLYVCDTFPPVVHAARIPDLSAPTVEHLPLVLGEMQLGPLARQGVTDIAGVVFDYEDPVSHVHTPTYRLWLTARPTTSETVVLFVEGTPPSDGSSNVPVFEAFAGNPVLTQASPVFTSCMRGCQIHGITATRLTYAPSRVRLLVERWVDTGLGLQYSLVPLEQVWRAD